MVLFNYATKEITAKIVYYGPGLCGKTTNLQFVYDSLPSNNKSKMLSLATKTDRTLFFDFLPLDLGKIRGMRSKLQLYTVPGQVYYNSTRQLVLRGADGVVFVVDSQDFALDANLESLQNLEDNLKRQGIRIKEIPLVLQYNKRDLPNVLPIEELEATVNQLGVPSFQSVATTGIGVEQTLKGVTQLVLGHLVKKYGLEGSEPLEKEIQILNVAGSEPSAEEQDTLWAEDNVLATTVGSPVTAGDDFVVEDDSGLGENVPLVATELVRPVAGAAVTSTSPFDELIERYEQRPGPRAEELPLNVPMMSVEIALPEGLLKSLPILDHREGAPEPEETTERRSTDGLVKEITIPLNLSLDDIRRHKKLRLKITIDVNLLS